MTGHCRELAYRTQSEPQGQGAVLCSRSRYLSAYVSCALCEAVNKHYLNQVFLTSTIDLCDTFRQRDVNMQAKDSVR